MSALPKHVKDLLNAVYGLRWGEAYLEWGTFPAPKQFKREGFGRAADVVPPDDMAVFWSAGLLKAGMGRANINVETIKVFVLDDVGFAPKSKISPLDVILAMPEPTIPIESSPGNWQWQWGLTDGMDEATMAALRASLPFKSDATAPSNLIRVPMGVSGKPGVTHKVRSEPLGPVYTAAELIEGCGGLKVPVATIRKARTGLLAPSVEHVRAALVALPNDGMSAYCKDYREGWITFGMALYGATGGEGYDLWEDWCAAQEQKRDLQYVWDSFHSTGIGWVKLHWMAREYGLKAFEAALQALGPETFNDKAEAPPVDDDEILALQRDVANWIVRKHGDRLRYNVSTSLWHKFDGVWRENPYALGYRLAKQWSDHAAPQLGPKAREYVSKSSFYAGVEKILQAEERISVVKTDFDQNDWLLGTPKGTVELLTGKLRAPVASEMISLSCVTAPSDKEDCPKWLKFVRWACTDPHEKDPLKAVDKGMMRMLKQWAGYCLTGDVAEEMVMFFHGGGANGKGTFIETMQWVMGGYFHMATKDLFMATKFGSHTEETAALAGKRMVAADEVPTNARWNESLLKGVSGGQTMSSRHLYGKVFTFPIRFKVTISGNEKPTFQGEINEALKRRLHLAEFLNTADPRSSTLKVELRAEAAGILRWALNGLQEMMREPGRKLFIADSAIAATDEYFSENDLFGEWLSTHTKDTPGVHTPAGKMFDDWKEFRNEQGNYVLVGDPKKFKKEMIKRGKTWDEARMSSVYKDISLILPVFAGGSGGMT